MLMADLLCAFIVATITLLLPLCTRYITQQVVTDQHPNPLQPLALMSALMLGLLLLQVLCNFFVDYHGHTMGAMMEADLRDDLFDHYQHLPVSFYDQQKTGHLMSLITTDLLAVSELYHHGPEDLVIAIVKFTGAFAILAYINLPLALIVMLFLPLMAAYAFYFHRRMTQALRQSRERIGDINAQLEDSLGGIRVVKSFTNEALEKQKFRHENQRFVQSRRQGYRSEAYFSAGLQGFIQLITIQVIALGALAITWQALDLADLLAFLMCIAILIEPIQRMLNFARLYQEGGTGFNRLMDVLELQPTLQDSPNAITLPHVQGQITFRGVRFTYHPNQDDVLSQLDLTIHRGEYVALVGLSGVGKTTLCSLIPRFYEVTAGEILLDGQNIKTLQLDWLRKQIGVVQQEVYLFAGSVADNIRYGRWDASQDEIIAAAKQANAHDFILGLPQGYSTDIGQRGVKLSGGQKQRLSIARVFLKNPPVLIFDEATSALDNDSEEAIRHSLEQLRQQRTAIVIAHRLSTIRNAQRILVLSKGRIAEQGTHATLLAQQGVYAALYAKQLIL
jgi:ATP-binding cassette subfamily B protein